MEEVVPTSEAQNTIIMSNISIILNLTVLLIFVSCGSQTQLSEPEDREIAGLECDKLKNYEEVRNIMDMTLSERFASLDIAKESIIGEWGLIGVQPAWIALEPGAECLHLTISKSTIIIKDLDSGNERTTTYELTPFEENNYSRFFLSTNDEIGNYQIGMSEFSENYMYGSGKFPDGNIYVYEKLR